MAALTYLKSSGDGGSSRDAVDTDFNISTMSSCLSYQITVTPRSAKWIKGSARIAALLKDSNWPISTAYTTPRQHDGSTCYPNSNRN